MRLKERGVTLGDLLLILTFIISIIFIINRVKENDKQAYFNITTIEIMTAIKS